MRGRAHRARRAATRARCENGGRAAEPLGRDADDGIILAVNADAAREQIAIEVLLLPVAIADDHRSLLAAGPFFVEGEVAAVDWLDAQRVEVTCS